MLYRDNAFICRDIARPDDIGGLFFRLTLCRDNEYYVAIFSWCSGTSFLSRKWFGANDDIGLRGHGELMSQH